MAKIQHSSMGLIEFRAENGGFAFTADSSQVWADIRAYDEKGDELPGYRATLKLWDEAAKAFWKGFQADSDLDELVRAYVEEHIGSIGWNGFDAETLVSDAEYLPDGKD